MGGILTHSGTVAAGAGEGLLLINKSQGLTSHDVVLLARRRLGIARIGHAGTLDPMAEGLLLLLVGAATKQQACLQTHRKRYEAVIRLGTQTETGDAWGRPVRTAAIPVLERTRVEAALTSLVGPLTQAPPKFSAVKVRGRPLYWWARRGTPMVAPSRTVTIFQAELLDWTPEQFRCRVDCSSGTYVRSLAESVAEQLGTVGHVSKLIRLAVGPWDLAHSHDVQWLATASREHLLATLRPMTAGHARIDRT